MSYEIEARFENDSPCLRILDADSHMVRLVWHYPRHEDAGIAADTAEQRAVRDLFRELFLLSLVRHEEGECRLNSADKLRAVHFGAASAGQPADTCRR